MNRRTFIKAAGMIVVATPVIASMPKPQQWILLTDRKPEIGQKIIVMLKECDFTTSKGVNVSRRSIRVGERVTTKDITCTISDSPPNFAMEQKFRMLVDYSSKNMLFYYAKADPTYSLENIRKLKWGEIYEERVISKFEHNISMMWVLDNIYWIPVNGQLPTHLPALPKYKK